jgi:hypothetical protein
MVLQVVDAFIEKDEVKWVELDKQYPNVIEKMFKSFEMVKEMLMQMNPRLLFEIEKYFPAAYARFREYNERGIHAHLVLDFKKGMQFGYFRKDIDVELSLFETQMILMDIFMRGILTEKGLVLYNSYQNNPQI